MSDLLEIIVKQLESIDVYKNIKKLLFFFQDDKKEPEEQKEDDPWAGLSYTIDLETGKSHFNFNLFFMFIFV